MESKKNIAEGKEIVTAFGREHRGTDLREWHSGEDAASMGETVAFAGIAGSRGRESYEHLETEIEREGFLDGIMNQVGRSERQWAHTYEMISLMKEEAWYWQALGYDNFHTFWHDKTAESFKTLSELEAVYNFAKTSRPELFDMTLESALEHVTTAQVQITGLKHVAPLEKGKGRPKGSKNFTTRLNAQNTLLLAAQYKPAAGNSLERRFARMKRDHYAVAERLLAGEFTNQDGKNWVIDMNAAEKECYGESNGERRKAAKAARVKESDLELLARLLKTKDEARRAYIRDAIASCEWV